MHSEITRTALARMRERLAKPLEQSNGRAMLMFSGGRDSSVVAAAFCIVYPRSQLHLLFIDNGLLSRMDGTKRQAELLCGLFPETDIVFEVKRVSQIMRAVGMQRIERDFTERGFHTLLICAACKLIMNYSAMRYAQELGINLVLDGYADRQSDFPEQTREFMTILEQVYRDAGLHYVSPLYDVLTDKGNVNLMLGELGVYIAKQEPICMFADSFSTGLPEEITRYTLSILEQIKQSDPVLHC